MNADETADDLDPAGEDPGEPVLPDPCEAVLVPGGPGKHLVRSRVRTPSGDYVYDRHGAGG